MFDCTCKGRRESGTGEYGRIERLLFQHRVSSVCVLISTDTTVHIIRRREASLRQGRNAEVLKLLVRLHDALVGEDELDRGRPPKPDPGLGDLVPVARRYVAGALQHHIVAGALQDDAVLGIFCLLWSFNGSEESGCEVKPDLQGKSSQLHIRFLRVGEYLRHCT